MERILVGIFGIDAELDHMAIEIDILLLENELLTHRNADLLSDQIDACQLFGHGVLHLDARVDFHEVEVVLFIEKKLHGPGRMVFCLFHNFDSCLSDLFAQLRRQDGAWRLLDQLLAASLNGAVSLAQMRRSYHVCHPIICISIWRGLMIIFSR